MVRYAAAAAAGVAGYLYMAATSDVHVVYDAVCFATVYGMFRLHRSIGSVGVIFGSGAEGPPRWDSLPIGPAGRRSVKGSAAPEPNPS